VGGRATVRNNVIGGIGGDAVVVDSVRGAPAAPQRAVAIGGNTIGGTAGAVGGWGIRVDHLGGSSGTALVANVSNNTVASTALDGVAIRVAGASTDATRVEATVLGNVIDAGRDAVVAAIGETQQTLCFDLRNSLLTAGPLGDGVYLNHRSLGAVTLPGYGGAPTSLAAVASFVQGNNAGASVFASPLVPGSQGFVGGGACAQP
jgi:hypothetical protein